MPDSPVQADFLFVTCQKDANDALKRELAHRWPELRLSYSRPGFLTFKLPPEHTLRKQLQLHSTFARTAGYCLGRVESADTHAMAQQVWQLAGEHPVRTLHVWQRDRATPGDFNFEPGPTPSSEQAEAAIRAAAPSDTWRATNRRRPAGRGQWVLDCILVEEDQWWVGVHPADTLPLRWPGGVLPLELPEFAVSRAYLKMEEALRWSQLPVASGEVCVEIGSAPGGAAQALLARGLIVNGVDPAEMDPIVLAEPNFRHLQMRSREIPRRDFAGVRWLTADMNVAPQYTLDAVEEIVTHADVHIRGMLLTLKLPDWQLADEIPAYLDRVRGWGYRDVRARQLAYNRQEICLAVLKHRSLRRLDARRRKRPARRK